MGPVCQRLAHVCTLGVVIVTVTCRRPRTARPQGEAFMDRPEANTVHVPAQTAAAWLTGQPEYNMRWPPCEGTCINGACGLRWDHPACCFVVPEDKCGNDGAAQQDGQASASIATTMGYWHSHDFYCWRGLVSDVV